VRLEAAHEGAVLALRSQVRIDLPERGLLAEVVDAAHREHREPGGDLDRAIGADLLRPLGDEDHIDVGHVVEFASPRLAHADDRKFGCRDLVRRERCVGAGHGERCLERSSCEIGERGGHPVDRAHLVRP
jgi:hypothetical protein